MDDDHIHFHSASGSPFSGIPTEEGGMGIILQAGRERHPSDAFEALPDDATRPTEVTIRPRYDDDKTTAWVSADIEDVVSLMDSR